MNLLLPKISKQIYYLTNKQRSKNHLKKLQWNPLLAKAALYHSRDMAKNHYCGHINEKHEDPTDRVKKIGFDIHVGCFCGVGENCNWISIGKISGLGFVSNTEHAISVTSIKSWMKSKGHRENILKYEYNLVGVGVATADWKTFYSTQVFYG